MGNSTPIGRVRGLGSAKEGAHHWWQQRLTAGSNLLLTLWFIVSVVRMPSYDYAFAVKWLGSPWVALPMVLLVISVFYHFRLGLQVVIEDYQHGASRIAWMLALNLFTLATGSVAIFAILKVAFLAGVHA